MSEPIPTWLENCAAVRGVIACGVRRADRSLAVRSARVDFPETEAEQTVRKVYEAVLALQQNQIHTNRVCWRFESVDVHCTAKPGGLMALVLVSKELANATEIERLLSEAPL
jgi:hypothetical protein